MFNIITRLPTYFGFSDLEIEIEGTRYPIPEIPNDGEVTIPIPMDLVGDFEYIIWRVNTDIIRGSFTREVGQEIVDLDSCPEPTPSPVPIHSEYGPKRVRTKEMDIEMWDPEMINRLEERKKAKAPSFCNSTFCIGVPKCG